MDAIDAIAGKKEGVKSRGKREIRERRNVVVGQINGILILEARAVQRIVSAKERGSKAKMGHEDNAGQKRKWRIETYFCNAQIFNSGYLVAWSSRGLISTLPMIQSVVICSFQCTHL